MNIGSTVIIIPARMASSRFPGKPLADIAGTPMIVHVWKRAIEADLGPVWVTCPDQEIADAIKDSGGNAVLTNNEHTSGSDRVHEAVCLLDSTADIIINLQGDCPYIKPETIRSVLTPLKTEGVDIATLAAATSDNETHNNQNIVKVVLTNGNDKGVRNALYFSRTPIPSGEGPRFHHVGIYGFRRQTLDQFAALPRSVLENREGLEQLRALEAGMCIGVELVDSTPTGVDTPEDLERVKQLFNC
tara:strand:- start:498 stop:1232 length:735 start_codon:yes stop_codon:yes gene_type:complete